MRSRILPRVTISHVFKSSQTVNSEDTFLRQADISTNQMEITALKSNENQDIMTHCGYLYRKARDLKNGME